MGLRYPLGRQAPPVKLGVMSGGLRMGVVTRLYRYPVKSVLGGVRPAGFRRQRRDDPGWGRGPAVALTLLQLPAPGEGAGAGGGPGRRRRLSTHNRGPPTRTRPIASGSPAPSTVRTTVMLFTKASQPLSSPSRNAFRFFSEAGAATAAAVRRSTGGVGRSAGSARAARRASSASRSASRLVTSDSSRTTSCSEPALPIRA